MEINFLTGSFGTLLGCRYDTCAILHSGLIVITHFHVGIPPSPSLEDRNDRFKGYAPSSVQFDFRISQLSPKFDDVIFKSSLLRVAELDPAGNSSMLSFDAKVNEPIMCDTNGSEKVLVFLIIDSPLHNTSGSILEFCEL